MQSILLIEDHAPMRRTLATALEMEGFEVLTAENGRIADVHLRRLDRCNCDSRVAGLMCTL